MVESEQMKESFDTFLLSVFRNASNYPMRIDLDVSMYEDILTRDLFQYMFSGFGERYAEMFERLLTNIRVSGILSLKLKSSLFEFVEYQELCKLF